MDKIEEVNIIKKDNNNQQIVGAIIIAGVLIAGAILLKGNLPQKSANNTNNGIPLTTLAPINKNDRTIGNTNAKVAVILYEDFQCPFCGAVSGLTYNTDALKYLKKIDPSWTPFMTGINENVKSGSLLLVYRDWAFLGTESVKSAEAARCASDQGKFWEYHDYLYAHQNGENKGEFSNDNLKTFAKILNLNTTNFNQCLDSDKYAQAVADAKTEGINAGVTGTPKGFILKDGKIVGTIDGAESGVTIKQKIDAVLK
ncbi:MAG: DsbA family protein [bacterium]